MEIYKARELLYLSPSMIETTLPKEFQIEYDNGVVANSTNRELIYTIFFWEFHRQYPNTPLMYQHHVAQVLNGKLLGMDTHSKLLTNISKSVYETYQLNTPLLMEPIQKLVYQVTNSIHNEISSYAEADVLSIDVLDFIEVCEYPEIKQAVDSVEPTYDSIDQLYRKVRKVLDTDPALSHNNLAQAVRSGLVNANQVNQCIAVRGFLTEVDGTIMPTPVMTNFVKGMYDPYELLAESRSGAKSLYLSDGALQDAEYFARRLQLLCMTIEKIDYVDCGTSNYLSWYVKSPSINERGNVIYPGDLSFMVGKYYLDESSGQLKTIDGSEAHLNGQTIKLRSSIFCQHHDKHKVCEVCFGQLAKNISRFVNVGHICSATMTQQTSQSVLSIKHLDQSSSGSKILMNELLSKFFSLTTEGNALVLKDIFKDKHLKMRVSSEEAHGLTDVLNSEKFDNLLPHRLSNIDMVELSFTEGDKETSIPVYINQSGRSANFTMDFLKYIKFNRWQTDASDNFVFSFTAWDYSLPIMCIPDVEYSFSEHSSQIAKIIESNMKNITNRANAHTPVATLQELFTLVNGKLNVNLAALEVIIYATMTVSKDNSDLARHHQQPILGIAEQIIKTRSLGAAYAYEDIYLTMTDPRSFFPDDRPDSVMDVFVTPREAVESYRAREN